MLTTKIGLALAAVVCISQIVHGLVQIGQWNFANNVHSSHVKVQFVDPSHFVVAYAQGGTQHRCGAAIVGEISNTSNAGVNFGQPTR